MNYMKPLMMAGAAISVAVGALTTSTKIHLPWKDEAPRVIFSGQGRDKELFNLVTSAKASIRVRTEQLSMVPLVNELGLAQQRGVSVIVELPLEDGIRNEELGKALMQTGAIVQWKSDLTSNYKGTYVEIDGATFLYSAAPLVPAIRGACISYVKGPVGGV